MKHDIPLRAIDCKLGSSCLDFSIRDADFGWNGDALGDPLEHQVTRDGVRSIGIARERAYAGDGKHPCRVGSHLKKIGIFEVRLQILFALTRLLVNVGDTVHIDDELPAGDLALIDRHGPFVEQDVAIVSATNQHRCLPVNHTLLGINEERISGARGYLLCFRSIHLIAGGSLTATESYQYQRPQDEPV